MRILLVSNYQPPHMGGIEFATQSLKRCWERDGHQVTLLTTDIPPGAAPSTPDNVRIPAVNFLEDRFQINSPLVLPWHRREISHLVQNADVVNVHSLAPGLGGVALRQSLRRGKPVVVTQHVAVIPLGSKVLTALQQQYVLTMARKCLRAGALLTFVGQAVRDWFLAEGKLDESKIFMTPAGIDQHTYNYVPDDERARYRAKWKLNNKALNVLFVGRFYDKKGLSILKAVAEQHPEIHFTLVGGGPVDVASWKLPNMRVIGFVSNEELRELYGAHDLFIMPSHGEGWPAVVPQAMACGLPCLISKECFAGFGRDPERFIVSARDSAEIAKRLAEFASGKASPHLARRSLSEYATATWDWQKTARMYVSLFERVIAQAATPAE